MRFGIVLLHIPCNVCLFLLALNHCTKEISSLPSLLEGDTTSELTTGKPWCIYVQIPELQCASPFYSKEKPGMRSIASRRSAEITYLLAASMCRGLPPQNIRDVNEIFSPVLGQLALLWWRQDQGNVHGSHLAEGRHAGRASPCSCWSLTFDMLQSSDRNWDLQSFVTVQFVLLWSFLQFSAVLELLWLSDKCVWLWVRLSQRRVPFRRFCFGIFIAGGTSTCMRVFQMKHMISAQCGAHLGVRLAARSGYE